MSAPPPGGTQPPPQQPWQAPPQASQPYPPQQPYQQPYYPPPQPPKKDNTILIVIVVIVVLIAVLGVVAWWAFMTFMAPFNSATQVTVTGVRWTVNYPGARPYFGGSPLTACTVCPFTVSIVSGFQYTLTLSNSDTVAHTVTGITLGYPFTLFAANPDPSSAPVTVPAQGSASILLTIHAAIGGSYTLSGVITTV